MARLSVFLIALFLALLPTAGYAQVNEASDAGFVMRVDGDLTVREGESVDAAIVISGNVQVDGTVKDFLMIIDGDGAISGRVDGDIIAISSRIDLTADAVIDGDVNLIDSDLDQAAGSQVLGDINDEFALQWWVLLLVNLVLWIGMTIAVLVFGLLLVAIAPRQAASAAAAMTDDPGWSILSAAIAFIGIPILAIIALVTVIGVPLGLGVLVFLLPALWFVGYLVGGLMLGTLIYSRAGEGVRSNRYLAVTTGLGVLQFIVLVPFLGILIAVLMALWGAGAVTLLGWRSFRAPRHTGPPVPA
jgi:hypothetical protein